MDRLSKLSHLERKTSIVDDLLFEIYDRWYDGRHDSFESDTFTECSSTSEVYHWRRNSFQLETDTKHSNRIHPSVLQSQSIYQLKKTVEELKHRINFISSRLIRQLKRRDRRIAKLQHNSDLVTAILQASSQKRRVDTRIRFSLEPPPGESAFDQWKDAMRAVARLPHGIPDSFRKKVWLSLADNYLKDQHIDWNKTVRFAFNERSNPDDNTLGIQIVKDLHRTGCSGFSGQDNDEDRAILKRVLLGYARWNKSVGYCQGFNVIAALLLEVMDRKEDDALKVMIYLIDNVLPDGYYAHNLRALSVDMAVFRDLLRVTFPKLSKHLDYLQNAAQDNKTGACYEPPLTNVFTMQWFLTLFATCLPKHIVLRVWDSILLEGSEILLRTALAIWGKLTKRILTVSTADEFYSLMGSLTQEMMEGRIFNADLLVKFIYACAPFPMQQLPELREKYTYNIRPFSSSTASGKKSLLGNTVPSDEDELDEEDLEAINCFTGIIPLTNVGLRGKGGDLDNVGGNADISVVGPGAYGLGTDPSLNNNSSVYLERMCTDIGSLKKQYSKLKQRQAQAHIIIAAASARQRAKVKTIASTADVPGAMNHLFVSKHTLPHVANKKTRPLTSHMKNVPVYPKPMLVPQFLQSGQKNGSSSHKHNKISDSATSKQSDIGHHSTNNKVKLEVEEEKSDCEIENSNDKLSKEESSDTVREEYRNCNTDQFSSPVGKESITECSDETDREKEATPSTEDLEQVTEDVVRNDNALNKNGCEKIEISAEQENTETDSLNAFVIDDSSAFQDVTTDSNDENKSKLSDSVFQSTSDDSTISQSLETESMGILSVIGIERHISIESSDCSLDDQNENCNVFSDDYGEEFNSDEEELMKEVDEMIQSCSEKLCQVAEQENLSFINSDIDEPVESKEKIDSSNNKHEAENKPDSNCTPESDGGVQMQKNKDKMQGNKNVSNSSPRMITLSQSLSLAQYTQSKRKMSSCSNDSCASKPPTDSETSSVFSPDASESSQRFMFCEKSPKSEKYVSWSSDVKSPSHKKSPNSAIKKPFNPFPVKHFNENRAKTGIKLGLYKTSTFDQMEKHSRRRPLWSK